MITLKEFGLSGKDTACVTKQLQKAIDTASQTAQELVVEKGVYVTGTLFLRSNLKMHLEKGAYIIGSQYFDDYSSDVNLFTDAVGHKRGRSFIYADNVDNVCIYGDGCINGRGELFSTSHPNHIERPFLMRIINSDNICIEGITLKNPAAWTLHLLNCKNINISGITIHSRVNSNNDGIDIDSCSNCVIEGCNIDTGDDAVCLKSTFDVPCNNITVRECVITSDWAGFKIGTESVGDYNNIIFEDSLIYDCNGCAIKICPVDGANVNGLTIKNINLINCTGPIFIANGDRLRKYHEGHSRNVSGSIKNILIENISGSCVDAEGTVYMGEAWGNAKSAICISGTDENHIDNVQLKNINLSMNGGVSEYSPHTIPPMGKRYPEFHNFGVLPAWGIYVRNTSDFKYSGLDLTNREPDIRSQLVIE